MDKSPWAVGSSGESRRPPCVIEPAPDALQLAVRPLPGTGCDPAIPDVDGADAPGRVTIGAGDRTARVSIQLLGNPDLTGKRALAVSVPCIGQG